MYYYRSIFILIFFQLFFIVNVLAQGNCTICYGTGQCQSCYGTGISIYRNCGGYQQALGCTSCKGTFGPNCNIASTQGSGKCYKCYGTGGKAESSSTPSYKDIEDKRIKDEGERKAEEQKKMKDAQEAESKRVRDEAAKQATLKRMGGATSQDYGLQKEKSSGTIKGANTKTFGLSGGVEETGMEKTEPSKEQRDINTAWKQLYCAKYILSFLNADIDKAQNGTANAMSTLNDVKYLGQEVQNALNGVIPGVECDVQNIPPPPKTLLEVEKKKQSYLNTTNALVNHFGNYCNALEKTKELTAKQKDEKGKQEELKKKIADLKSQAPSPVKAQSQTQPAKKPASKDDETIAKAIAEQEEWKKKDQEKINEIYKQQKENESALAQNLAAQKAIQLQINKENSKKISESDLIDQLQLIQ